MGLERRKYLQKARYKFNYHLEAPENPGVFLDSKLTLSSQVINMDLSFLKQCILNVDFHHNFYYYLLLLYYVYVWDLSVIKIEN